MNTQDKNSLEGTLARESLEENKYKIILYNNCKSIDVEKQEFTNKLESINISLPKVDEIIKVVTLKDKIVRTDELPFYPDDYSPLKLNSRINSIFKHINYEEKARNIIKNIYASEIQKNNIGTEKGQKLRVYTDVDKENKVLTIVLLDPHHLLATTITEYYSKAKNFRRCISELPTNRFEI